jgi:hypothetical protein
MGCTFPGCIIQNGIGNLVLWFASVQDPFFKKPVVGFAGCIIDTAKRSPVCAYLKLYLSRYNLIASLNSRLPITFRSIFSTREPFW